MQIHINICKNVEKYIKKNSYAAAAALPPNWGLGHPQERPWHLLTPSCSILGFQLRFRGRHF